MGGKQLQTADFNQFHQRIVPIVDGVGIIGQGHDLSFIFQFPHVHEICRVFKKNSQRDRCRNALHERQPGMLKLPDAA